MATSATSVVTAGPATMAALELSVAQWEVAAVEALTHYLSERPDSSSPDGSAEIRDILTFPAGGMAHAVCPAGMAAGVHELPELDEAYFILAGKGEIWRRMGDHVPRCAYQQRGHTLG